MMTPNLPVGITVEVDGRRKTVATSAYVAAKTKQLREFGYPNLTERDVAIQLGKLLTRKKLTVIGMFMEGEVVL